MAANGTYYRYLTGESYTLDYSEATVYMISLTIGGVPYSITPYFGEETLLCSSAECSTNELATAGVATDNPTTAIELIAENSGAAITKFDVNSQSDVSAMLSNPADKYVLGVFGTAGVDDLTANLTLSPTPEPSSWLSLAMGLAGLAFLKSRRSIAL
jgi:hypothetical protein